MPNLDQTGPRGFGPITGRGMGPCGQGYGGGYGFGRGNCPRRYFTQAEEKDVLAEDIKNLEEDLKAAKERLTEIKSK